MNDYIRITKVKTINVNPNVKKNYWVEGILTRDIKVGSSVKMWRMRNSKHPEGRFGLFETSPVKVIKNSTFETENSVYRLRHVKVPKTLLNSSNE